MNRFKKNLPASPKDASQGKTRREVNLRLVFGTFLVLLAAVPAAWIWQKVQVSRNANALVEQADASEKKQDYASAANFLYRYLKLRPDDALVQARLAGIVDKSSSAGRGKQRAIDLYYQALGVAKAQDAPAIRCRLAELLLEAGKPVSADEESLELLKSNKDNPQGWRLWALALFAQSRTGTPASQLEERIANVVQPMGLDPSPTSVADLYKQALKLDAKVCDSSFSLMLAQIYRQQIELLSADEQKLPEDDRKRLADAAVDAMVNAAGEGDRAWQALLARYRYRTQFKLAGGDDDLDKALAVAPDAPDVVFTAALRDCQAADAANRNSEKDQAETCLAKTCQRLEHLIKVAPGEIRAYLRLGEIYASQNKPEEAISAWRRGLERTGKDNPLFYSLIAEVLLSDGKLAEAKQSIDAIGQIIDKYSTRMDVDQRQAATRSLTFLQAKWNAAKGDHRQVIALAKELALGSEDAKTQRGGDIQAYGLLGSAYAGLGEWDLAASAFEQAAALNPKLAQPRLLAAKAWIAGNRPEMAIRCCQQALAVENSPEAWLALAQASFYHEVKIPKSDRKWNDFDKALAEAQDAKASNAVGWQARLLGAQYAIIRAQEEGQKEQGKQEASRILTSLETTADSPEMLSSLVATCHQLGLPEATDRNLVRLSAVSPQASAPAILKARVLASRGEYEEARKTLQAIADKVPEAAQANVRNELARLSIQQGNLDGAAEALAAISAGDSSAIDMLCSIADLALEKADRDTVKKCEAKLRLLEGAESIAAMYYEARRLLLESTTPDDAAMIRAGELQSRIQSRRPGWANGYLLAGLLSEARGNAESALEAYQEAIRLGDERLIVFDRVITLLGQTNRIAEMDRYLAILQERVTGSEVLSGLEISVAVRRGQIDRAVELARQVVERRPDEAAGYISLGRILLTAEKNAEAETAFKRAVELAPDDIRALSGLFGLYAHNRQTDLARATLERIAKTDKLSPAERELSLARGYEYLGDAEKAEAAYRKAAQLAPENNVIQMAFADALRRSASEDDITDAEKALRTVIKRSPTYAPARRLLAEILAERGGESQWQEAQLLLERTGLPTISAVDRRIQAMLLVRRGGKENLAKARTIFEELVGEPNKTAASDRLWLARIYEMTGSQEEARRSYAALADRDNAAPSHQAAYVDFLLRHGPAADADALITKLEKAAPTDLGVAALRARWLKALSQTEKIEPMLESLAKTLNDKVSDDKAKQATLANQIGALYAEVGQNAAAERWYRRLVELEPERYAPLASSLVRQGKLKEAVELCAAATKADDASPKSAVALCSAILKSPLDADALTVAWPLLDEASKKYPEDATLLMSLAAVRVLAGQSDAAVALYQQVLKRQPGNILALNNLATLLAESKSSNLGEALRYIDQAIEKVGPQAALLDTKGMILVQQGKAENAIELLQQAVLAGEADPRYAFHLAVAYARSGDDKKAREAFQTADSGELTNQVLTTGDRKMLDELKKQLAL